jgi:hypothetical protein
MEHAMTTKAYLAALKKLSLQPHSKATAAALGISLRQCQRYAKGTQLPNRTIELLLAMYLKHSLPLYLALPWR